MVMQHFSSRASFTPSRRSTVHSARNISLKPYVSVREYCTEHRLNTRRLPFCVCFAGDSGDSAPQGRESDAVGDGDDNNTYASSRKKSLKAEARENNTIIYDKLIEVFRAKKPEEWKKLIVYSVQWPSLASGVFDRIEDIAASKSDDPDEQLELRRFLRRLVSVSDMLAEQKDLLDQFRQSSSMDWESLVARYRASMGADFFEYIELRIRAAQALHKNSRKDDDGPQDEGMSAEAEALAALGTQLAVLVDAYDKVVSDESALDAASQSFAELLQSDSMETAEAKLDSLAASGKLDPALLLTMAKAYSGVKETDITKEEVKDIMAHLYFKAKEKFASQAPPEARILKFLLSVDSESERMSLLEQAFQPGADLSTTSEDYLHTTPDALLNTIENILTVYDTSKTSTATMMSQASSLMNPEVIERMRQLRDLVRKKYT